MADNGNNNGNGESGQSLQQTADTTKALLEANLDAGVPAPEALENRDPDQSRQNSLPSGSAMMM